jgi:hypothetical protein
LSSSFLAVLLTLSALPVESLPDFLPRLALHDIVNHDVTNDELDAEFGS